jgi:4-hydroxy-4-methyl-2-oxoglutarate aldolase
MLEEPPLLTISRQYERAHASAYERFAGAQTGQLVDAMEGRGALDCAIKPIDPAQSAFVGTAITCETGASDNLAILAALHLAQPGDVIVAAADGFTGTAVIGDIVAAVGRNRGVRGFVIDGAVRDRPGLIAAGVPVFARAITPNSCAKSGPGRVGFPVSVGGVAVASGDIILGDIDGVVVVPRDRADAVFERLGAIVAAEAAVQEKIAKGMQQMDAITALLKSDRVRYVS